jgi:hypothetical protein
MGDDDGIAFHRARNGVRQATGADGRLALQWESATF